MESFCTLTLKFKLYIFYFSTEVQRLPWKREEKRFTFKPSNSTILSWYTRELLFCCYFVFEINGKIEIQRHAWWQTNERSCAIKLGWVKLVETYKSRLLKLLLLIIVWLWSPLLGWITINCSPDQFLILHLIRRTLYHLHQKVDLSTSINISFEKIY